MSKTLLGAAVAAVLAGSASAALAQVGPNFDPNAWQRGPVGAPPAQPSIWNPVMQKIRNGEPIFGGTIRGTDPRIYCAMASAGYDFTWVEMQHDAISWEQVARLWATCPGPAAPGVRVAMESEQNLQIPVDMGALVIFVPTVDTVEEAQRAVEWTYYPPLGKRSDGGGQGPTTLWGQVPGGFRATWNQNVVLILMIETLEGVKNARAIAQIPGVTGLFAAAGDIGNFSGYAENDPQYEMLITEIVQAARAAGKVICGPMRWAGVRPEYNCFQANTEAANIQRGAQAELQAARNAFTQSSPAPASAADAIATLNAQCNQIIYEADCFNAVRQAAAAAAALSAGDRQGIVNRIRDIANANPARAARIREIAAGAGLQVN